MKKFLTHIYNYTIQETDLDFLGHVNNATYVRIFEQARWQLITDRGLSLKKITTIQQCPIILSIHIKYLKELTARQEIYIETVSSNYSGKVGTLTQAMKLKTTDEAVCKADISFGIFDMKIRKLIEPTDLWLNTIG